MWYIKYQKKKIITAVKLRYWNRAVYLLQTKQVRVKKNEKYKEQRISVVLHKQALI